MTLYRMFAVAHILFNNPRSKVCPSTLRCLRGPPGLVTDMPNCRFCIDLYSRGNVLKFSFHAWKHGDYPQIPCLFSLKIVSEHTTHIRSDPSISSSDMNIAFPLLHRTSLAHVQAQDARTAHSFCAIFGKGSIDVLPRMVLTDSLS